MLTATVRRLRTMRSDAGVTLAELVVAMGLATLIATVTMFVFVSTSSAVNSVGDSFNASGSARAALQSWQTLIAAADAPQTTNTCPTGTTGHRFEWLTSTETLFYADLHNRAADGTCTPQTMVWLALRKGRLLEARYTIAAGQTAYSQAVCRTLSFATHATASAGALFTPNPGQVLTSVDYGATFASTTPFAAVTGCANAPTSVSTTAVSDTDTSANNALAQVNSVGIDFTLTDQTGKHTQTYDTTVTVLGGSS
jgi:hypothetical protein